MMKVGGVVMMFLVMMMQTNTPSSAQTLAQQGEGNEERGNQLGLGVAAQQPSDPSSVKTMVQSATVLPLISRGMLLKCRQTREANVVVDTPIITVSGVAGQPRGSLLRRPNTPRGVWPSNETKNRNTKRGLRSTEAIDRRKEQRSSKTNLAKRLNRRRPTPAPAQEHPTGLRFRIRGEIIVATLNVRGLVQESTIKKKN